MTHHDNHNEKHSHHVVPLKTYFLVWIGLIIGTVVTVATSYIDFGGSMNIVIAMLIATIKALMVILIFMGLKYEGYENNVTFFCTFVFLAIFVGLTSADLFYRFDTTAAVVDTSEAPQSAEPVDLKKLTVPEPESIAKGKQIYSQQCMTCHGEGKGDGPAAAALNPKPRNFTVADGWKNGRGLDQVFKTLTIGLPGTPMPPFSGLSVGDRMALAHYVRTLGPQAPAVDATTIAALEKDLGGAPKKHIPVPFAMKLISEGAGN